MITAYDTPAQQQALPYQAQEPLAAYANAMGALQGRFDKSYQATKQTEHAISSLQVRGADEGSKQAYVNVFKGQVQRILDSHGGNYGAAQNELDSLANWITSDGHLAKMNNLYTQAAEVQKKRAESNEQGIDFNLDLLNKPYFNNDASTNPNLNYQSEERQDILKPMEDLFKNLKPWQKEGFKKFAQNPDFYENYHGADLEIQRIREFGKTVFPLYTGTKAGNQRVRELAQLSLRDLTSNRKGFLHQGSASELQYAQAAGQRAALKELLDFGSGFEQHEVNRSLIHDPDATARRAAAEAARVESAQMITGQQVGHGEESATNPNILTEDDLSNMEGNEQTPEQRQSQSNFVQGATYLGQAALGVLNLIPGVRENFDKSRQGVDNYFTKERSMFNDAKVGHVLQTARANAGSISGGAAIVAKLSKPGARLGDLSDTERKNFTSFYRKNAQNIPINQFKSSVINTISPDDVHIPGFEHGAKSYEYALFKTSSGRLRDASANLPLYPVDGEGRLSGQATTLGKVKEGIDFSKTENASIPVGITGFVTPNSEQRLNLLLNRNSRYAAVNIGGQTFYTDAPDQVVTTTKEKGVTTGRSINALGNYSANDQVRQQRYNEFMHGRTTTPRPEPVAGAPGWQVQYDIKAAGVSPEHNIVEAAGDFTFIGPKGQRFSAKANGLNTIPNFFSVGNGGDASYSGAGFQVTNGDAWMQEQIFNHLGKK